MVKRLIAICCAGVMAASVAACGAETDTRTAITVWSWEPSMKQVIAGFEKENPDIRVIWKNTSGYDKLNNAIQDGYGIPDVVQLDASIRLKPSAFSLFTVSPALGLKPQSSFTLPKSVL